MWFARFCLLYVFVLVICSHSPFFFHSIHKSVKLFPQSLEEEAEDFEEEIESLQSHAEVVLQYLRTVSAVAYTSAKEKLERLLRRHPE